MANELATDVTMTNDDYRELDRVEEPFAKREVRRRQLLARAKPVCVHGTPEDERCFKCEPLRLELFKQRDQVPTGNRRLPGSHRR